MDQVIGTEHLPRFLVTRSAYRRLPLVDKIILDVLTHALALEPRIILEPYLSSLFTNTHAARLRAANQTSK